jgi:DNA-binding transcriptional MerR regulator
MDSNDFTVGELSELTGVSKQAIRYYDRIGLLKPGRIDRQSGYRYYGPIHLLYLNSIMRLSQLGCSLKETARYLYGANLTDVRRMLQERRRLTGQKILDLKRAMAALESQICQIEEGMSARTDEIGLKRMPERRYVHLASCQPPSLKSGIMQVGRMVCELRRQGMLFVASPVFELTGDARMLKTGFFVETEGAQGFDTDIVPAGEYAFTYHRGRYDRMGGSLRRLYDDIDTCGKKVVGGTYQIYLIDFALTQNEDELLTELQVRIC